MNEHGDDTTRAAQTDEQSLLTDDLLLCDECSRAYETGPRLEKTGEATHEDVRVEDFECPDCGATGYVEQDRETEHVTRCGCVTTPRLIDLERAAAWERAHGGGR